MSEKLKIRGETSVPLGSGKPGGRTPLKPGGDPGSQADSRKALGAICGHPSLVLLLDSLSEGVALVGAGEARIRWANRAFLDALGRTAEQVYGTSCMDSPPDGSPGCRRCPVQRALRSAVVEEDLVRSDDGRLWRVRGIPVLEGGKVDAALELREDVTSLHELSGELERSREEFRLRLEEQEQETQKIVRERETIIDKMTDFVYRHDETGVFTYLSPSVERITGYCVEEWCQHYCQYLTDHPDNDWVVQATERTLRTGEKSDPYRVEIYHGNGGRVTLEVDEEPIIEDGRVTGIVGVARDVTDQVLAERVSREAQRTLQSTLDTLPLRLYWKDLDSRYLGGNQLFARDAGLRDAGELAGLSDFDLPWRDEAEEHRNDDFEVMHGGEAHLDYEVRREGLDGGEVWHRESKIPLRDESGTVIGLLGVYEDISAERTARLESRNQLLDLLEEKTRSLVEMRDTIGRRREPTREEGGESRPRSRQAMQAMQFSRELRYPLDAALQLIGRRLLGDVDGVERKELESAHHAARTLQEVLGDLLRFSGQESLEGVLRQPFNLEGLLADVLELMRARAREKGLELELDGSSRLPRRVIGDRARLRQVLINLLGNAVRYTREGWVRLEVRPSTERDDGVEFTVRDSGDGMDPGFLEKRLERSGEDAYAGGLPGSKKLVEMMGGRIEASSEPGRGSTLRFVLPLGSLDPLPRGDAVPGSLEAEARLMRVLLVGGGSQWRAEIREVLENASCAVEDTGSFGRGEELERHGLYDAVLLDCDADREMALRSARTISERVGDAPCSVLVGLAEKPDAELRSLCLHAGLRELLDRRLGERELDRLLVSIQTVD